MKVYIYHDYMAFCAISLRNNINYNKWEAGIYKYFTKKF